MILGFLLLLCAFALFVALHLFAAGVFALGVIVLTALWLRRKAEFWPLLLAMALLFGDAGALGGSWGAYFGTMQLWPDSMWPIAAWVFGFALGGGSGVLLGVFGIALKRRSELPQVEAELKTRFLAMKNQFSRLGLRQTLRVGVYSLRVAFSRRVGAKN